MTRISRLIVAERAVITMIVVNSIALAVMAHLEPPGGYRFTQIFDHPPYAIAWWVGYACVVYFLVEMIIKVKSYGFSGYWKSGWNRFDFVVVVVSLPVLFVPFGVNLAEGGVLLTLRLGRLFRLFRVMRFIPNREHLYDGIQRALRASVGVFLAILLLNVILALGATQLFGELDPEHFGNPLLASYSIFQVFTVEGWNEIPQTIVNAAAEHHEHPVLMGVLARLFFAMTVTVGGLLGLALANAVFVDEMMMDNNEDLEKKVDALTDEVRALRELLSKRDA